MRIVKDVAHVYTLEQRRSLTQIFLHLLFRLNQGFDLGNVLRVRACKILHMEGRNVCQLTSNSFTMLHGLVIFDPHRSFITIFDNDRSIKYG